LLEISAAASGWAFCRKTGSPTWTIFKSTLRSPPRSLSLSPIGNEDVCLVRRFAVPV
jgi:hypothetical protein